MDAHRYPKQKKQNNSFFACCNCNFDEREIDGQTFSRFGNKKQPLKLTTAPQRGPTERSLRQSRNSKYELYANSSATGEDKISVSRIRNRKSVQYVQPPKTNHPYSHKQLPDFLPPDNRRKSVQIVENNYIPHTYYRGSVPEQNLRISGPQNYQIFRQTQPAVNFAYPKQEQFQTTSQVYPSPQTRPLPQMNPPPQPVIQKVGYPQTTEASYGAKSKAETPKKKDVAEPKVELEFTNKTISQMYDQKEVYNSYVPPMAKMQSNRSNSGGKLTKKHSNFGNGKVDLKIRQAVSIGGEESDHESFVMSNSSEYGFFKGLKPIDESQQLSYQNQSEKWANKRWLEDIPKYD